MKKNYEAAGLDLRHFWTRFKIMMLKNTRLHGIPCTSYFCEAVNNQKDFHTNDMTNQVLNGSQLVGRAADNVTSFLSGIRASFRTENVYVAPLSKPKKKDQTAANNKD